ncbi:MAG: hypothetical protein AAF919_02700 [Pseudomonadota bacterium]
MIRLATALGLLIALPLPILAQEVLLKLNVAPGTRIIGEEQADMEMALKLAMAGQTMDLDQTVGSRMPAIVEILEVDADGVPTKARVSFDAAASVSSTAMGQSQDAAHVLAGQTVTLSRGPSGTVIDPDPGIDPAQRAEIAGYLDLSRNELPGRAISVGDSWPGSISALPGEATGEATFTLNGLRSADGREVADISIGLDFSGDMDGATMTGTGSGQGVIDVATGLWLDSSIDVTGSFEGTAQEAGIEAQVSGTMSGSTTYTARLENVAASTGASEGTPAPTTETVDRTETETFTDGTLTVTLTGDQVEIIQNGQTYPGRIISTEGDALSGTFTASGTAFPFEARREGDGLVLTSGGTTYVLAREPGATTANPLAGQ